MKLTMLASDAVSWNSSSIACVIIRNGSRRMILLINSPGPETVAKGLTADPLDCGWLIVLRSGVNFTHFLQKWPKNQHLSSKCLHQSLDFHEFTFSPPGVLVYESDGGSHLPAFE